MIRTFPPSGTRGGLRLTEYGMESEVTTRCSSPAPGCPAKVFRVLRQGENVSDAFPGEVPCYQTYCRPMCRSWNDILLAEIGADEVGAPAAEGDKLIPVKLYECTPCATCPANNIYSP